jgi:penicillin-binding protein 1C
MTIGVWVGRPDGAPVPGLVGRAVAAPILFDAFARISDRKAPFRPAPVGVVKATTASLPPPLKRFREPSDDAIATGPFLEPPVLISFPLDRSELDLAEREAEPLIIKAEGGALPLTWLIDGNPMTSDPLRREVEWQPDGRGFAKLTVIDAKGHVDRVSIRLR